MPSKAPDTALRDILRHIELATVFAQGLERADFLNDLRTVYAVTRCLEIISEASRRVPEAVKEKHPSIPWKQMAAAGNIFRHDYEDVAARYVWNTLTRDLPVLREVVLQETGGLG